MHTFCSIWARLSKWEIIYGLKLIIKRFPMSLTSNWFKVIAHHYPKSSAKEKYKPNRAKRRVLYINAFKIGFLWIPTWPWHLTYKYYSSSLHTVLSKALYTCKWISSQIEANGEKNAPDKDFSYNSAMTIIFHLENWFKVTTHSYSKDLFMWRMNQG